MAVQGIHHDAITVGDAVERAVQCCRPLPGFTVMQDKPLAKRCCRRRGVVRSTADVPDP